MSYYQDLSPYVYVGAIPGAVNVGWLDREHDFPKGKVPGSAVKKLRRLAENPAVRHRGFHQCEFCGALGHLRWSEKDRRSSSVFTVRRGERIYAAPKMIIHYIVAHHYLPPGEFLEALDESPNNSAVPTP